MHVRELLGRRIDAVAPPHDHRRRADLALGDPADVVFVVPGRDARRLAEVAAVGLLVAVGHGPDPTTRHRPRAPGRPARANFSPDEGPDPRRRRRHAASPDHAHEREAARPDREQADHLLRHRAARRRRHQGHRHRHPVGETGNEIRAAVGDGSQFGVEITYIEQDAPRGLAHCVLIARDFLGDDDFVMYLGDNMLQDDLRTFVDRFLEARDRPPELGEEPRRRRPRRSCSRTSRTRATSASPSSTCTATSCGSSRSRPTRRRISRSSACTSSRPLIHDAVRAIQPSARGELEITDAIQWLLDDGHPVRHEILQGWWIDTGKKDPLLHCNRLVLDTIEHRIDGHVDDAVTRRAPRHHRRGRRADRLGRARARDHRRPHPPRRHLRRARTRRSPPTAS